MALYYLSTTGNDSNSGASPSSAFATAQFALGHLHAGDTLYIIHGVYDDRILEIWFGGSGTLANPVNILAFPGDNVTFRPNFVANVMRFQDLSIQYVQLGQITFDGILQAPVSGVSAGYSNAKNITFNDIKWINSPGHGYLVYGSSLIFNRCEANNNGIANSVGDPLGANGWYVGFVTDSQWNDCIANGNFAWGMRLGDSGPLDAIRNTVTNFLTINNGQDHGIGGTSTGGVSGGGGLVVGDGWGGANKFINIIGYNNFWGFNTATLSGSAAKIEILNSLFAFNDHGMWFFDFAIAPIQVYCANTISILNGDSNFLNDLGNNPDSSLTGSNNITSGSVNWVNSSSRDFHLLATASNCIQQGLPLSSVTIDFDGNPRLVPPDIGPFQSVSTVPPINIGYLTATDLGLAPNNGTQRVDSGGITYTVWYKFTPISDGVYGFWFFGDLITYRTVTTVYTVPVSTPIIYVVQNASNVPFQISLISGTTYYFKIEYDGTNPTPAILTWSTLLAPQNDIPVGSFLIPDDTSPGMPAAIISSTTGEVINFVRTFAGGELGDRLQSGISAFYDSGTDSIIIYDINLNVINTITGKADLKGLRANLGQNKFYTSNDLGATHLVNIINSDGSLSGTTYTMNIADIGVFATTNDGTFAIHAPLTSGTVIKKWNLLTAVAVTDFCAGLIGYIPRDILVLSNNNVVISYSKVGINLQPFKVLVYDSSGTLLNTVDIGDTDTPANLPPRIGYGANDSYFNAFYHPNDQGIIQQIRASDGFLLNSQPTTEFQDGIYAGLPTDTPTARFGNSNKCPIIELFAPIIDSNLGTVVVSSATLTITKLTSPSGSLLSFSFNISGLSPSTFTLLDGESRIFTNVPAGTYSLTENIPSSGVWSTTFGVSNDDPNNAINISVGDDITVTVTNTVINSPKSGIYKIIPESGKTNDSLWNTDFNGTIDVKISDPFARIVGL